MRLYSTMNMCRTCLRYPAHKDISELADDIDGNNKKYQDIMKFCLDIQVAQDSKITTNLCDECFRKIISFYKFKATALENDAYLKSMHPVVQLLDKQLIVCVDGNGAKCENSDKLDSSFEDNQNYKTEVKVEADTEIKLESPEQEFEYEYIEEYLKEETAAPRKKQASQKKEKKKKSKSVNEGTERQICDECGMSVKNLAEHSLRHQPKEDRQMLECKACSKLFSSRQGRQRHFKSTHLGIRDKCDICDKEYTKSGLKQHKLRAHNLTDMRYQCAVCARRCSSKSELNTHVTVHTKVRPFECDMCHKTFSNKHIIAVHIRQVHYNEKNYQCELCPKAFFQKKALEDHLRTHTRELEFKCDDCGKMFWTKASLRIHRISHSDTKNYHCEVCGRSFLRLGTLKNHMLSHTKEKPFQCRHCPARFGRSTHRSRHELALHKKLAVG